MTGPAGKQTGKRKVFRIVLNTLFTRLSSFPEGSPSLDTTIARFIAEMQGNGLS